MIKSANRTRRAKPTIGIRPTRRVKPTVGTKRTRRAKPIRW